MYKYFRLVTLTLNTEGGSSETIEKMTKEVKDEEGKVSVVPCTAEESELKLFNKMASVGGNPSTQSIKCMLLNADGNVVKVEELKKPIEVTE